MIDKESKYKEIVEAKCLSDKLNALLEYLYLDSVDVFDSDEVERISDVLFTKDSRIHITTSELLMSIINDITIQSLLIDKVKYQKYLKILGKYSVVLNSLSIWFLEDLIDEIKRVLATQTVIDIIDALPLETRLLVVENLIKVTYWRNAIPKLELYDTFS